MNTRYTQILSAIKSFDFGDYGMDQMDDIVNDDNLDLGKALADHIDSLLAS